MSSGRGRRRAVQRRPGRVLTGLAVVLAVLGLSACAWATPQVRTVLRQSFTEQPAPYTELYFTTSPTFDGNVVIVPMAVDAHGTGATSYQLQVQLESSTGAVVAATTVKLVPRNDVPVQVTAHLQVPSSVSASVGSVAVSLVGHPQRLHFTFGH